MHYIIRTFILLALTSATFGQWVELESGTTSNLNGISAPATHFAVAVGDNATIRRTMDYGVTWAPLTGEPGIDYHAVSFPSPAFGLAAGTSGTILFTNNGGEIWETVETGWMHPYYAAEQASPLRGAVAGVNSIFQPIVGLTFNGWQDYDFHVFYPQQGDTMYEGTIRDIHFFDADTGLAAIQVWDGHGAICRTVDGGTNWATVEWNDNAFYALDFDVYWGCAVGANGLIAISGDNGETWLTSESPTTQDLLGVTCEWSGDVWAVGELGTILHSGNGGYNWDLQASPVTTNLNGVSFAGADTGYAVGDNGVILFTPNGGEAGNQPPGEFVRVFPVDSVLLDTNLVLEVPLRWTTSIDPDGDAVSYTVHFWSSDWDCIVENNFSTWDTTVTAEVCIPLRPLDDVHHFHWRVFARDGQDSTEASNGEGMFLMELPASAEGDFIPHPSSLSLSAFPNPFNPATTLNLSLPVSSEAVLRVFDVTGRLVRETSLGRLQSGSHAIAFDGSDLPSGIYLAAVDADKAHAAMKIILMR